MRSLSLPRAGRIEQERLQYDVAVEASHPRLRRFPDSGKVLQHGWSKSSSESIDARLLAIEMQTAFSFDYKKAGVLLTHPRLQWNRCMYVTDGHVPGLPQRVKWQTVTLEIVPHAPIAPIGQWMKFPASVAQFNEFDRLA